MRRTLSPAVHMFLCIRKCSILRINSSDLAPDKLPFTPWRNYKLFPFDRSQKPNDRDRNKSFSPIETRGSDKERENCLQPSCVHGRMNVYVWMDLRTRACLPSYCLRRKVSWGLVDTSTAWSLQQQDTSSAQMSVPYYNISDSMRVQRHCKYLDHTHLDHHRMCLGQKPHNSVTAQE